MWRKFLTVVITIGVFIALISGGPEVLMLHAIIEAVGFDTFVMLCEAQIIAIFYTYFGQYIQVFFSRINASLEKIDPFYFIPTKQMVKEFPPVIYHAFPFLIGGIIVCYTGATVFA